jgi:hypothetical protein
MKSLFVEGLETALWLVENKSISALKALIAEHHNGILETTAILPNVETR